MDRVRLVALLSVCAARAWAASPEPCGPGSVRAWKRETEPGVSVSCGPSKGGVPGECEFLTVAPRGAKAWQVVQDDVRQSVVHTARHGEVLLVAEDRGLRLFTRKGRYNTDRKRQVFALARVVLELTPEERARMRQPGCTEGPVQLEVKPLDERRVRLEVQQREGKKRLPPVELDLVLDEAVVTRATNPPPPAAPDPR